MLTSFELCPIRCKIGDVRISRVYPYNYYTGEAANTEFPDALGVSLTLTFYETMHDGVPDAAISTQ